MTQPAALEWTPTSRFSKGCFTSALATTADGQRISLEIWGDRHSRLGWEYRIVHRACHNEVVTRLAAGSSLRAAKAFAARYAAEFTFPANTIAR